MKKTLVLVRHATAEDQNFRTKDFDRNLNSKGLAEAEAMGKWLAGSGIRPDVFVTSPASRAYKTAEIIAGELGVNASSLITNAEIYDGGPQSYLNAVNAVPENFSMLMLFGHNPDITYFAEYLTGSNLGSMKKGSMAMIDFEGLNWAEISAKTGNLNLYKTPREVREAE
ncbi:SixA phosphatase family protein [Dyadobacter sediminis]|uniref:Histidine phosphatase family protein n=1 Tax=Dyadobacter sediminis TaxID=1493691 RepID=A0A5R9KE90_9BACT|nr:histidine phosphatase family protein [Dyadobacter sediminis]TLU94470.1 histidine phosphatase family protein [Dyadobacter sediminis]GGB90956.1 phosphohistidine phosphatase SixA [Dyadobacter sediminis]